MVKRVQRMTTLRHVKQMLKKTIQIRTKAI